MKKHQTEFCINFILIIPALLLFCALINHNGKVLELKKGTWKMLFHQHNCESLE
jgi:hypothetical protein